MLHAGIGCALVISMKAKEYFEKYAESVWEDFQQDEFRGDGPIAKMFIEFMVETEDICEKRGVKINRALISVVDERNKKWNALASLFIKKYGQSPIKHDGYLNGAESELGVSLKKDEK